MAAVLKKLCECPAEADSGDMGPDAGAGPWSSFPFRASSSKLKTCSMAEALSIGATLAR